MILGIIIGFALGAFSTWSAIRLIEAYAAFRNEPDEDDEYNSTWMGG